MATILTVDDDPEVRKLLKIVLSLDHQVVPAANATEAIELARRLRPDLVLLDLDLGKHHDGLEVCRTLRNEADPTLAQVPIVMLTGQTTKADIQAALKAGANSYMGKPYSPKSLLAVVSALLAKKGT
jgi:DNA-binding response OmpR family regulator